MSDLYDMTTKMLVNDRASRLRFAETCGIGFELPSVVPNVPNVPITASTTELAQPTELEAVDLWV